MSATVLRYIRPVAKELNIDRGGWHDFRHTVAISMLRAGHGVKVISELLGHSDVSITLRTYDHVESDAFRAPFERSGEPVVVKLLRNGFQRKNRLL